MSFLASVFKDLGFEGDEIDVRSRAFLHYHVAESGMIAKESKKRRRELLMQRLGFFTRK